MKFSTSILAIVCTLAATAFAAPSPGQDNNPIEARQACPEYQCTEDSECSAILCGGCTDGHCGGS